MRPAYLLASIPIAATLIGPFFLNRTLPFILGMPLLLGWLAVTLVVTSLVMTCIYYLDGGRTSDAGDEQAESRP
jgi:hypothetical protein